MQAYDGYLFNICREGLKKGTNEAYLAHITGLHVIYIHFHHEKITLKKQWPS